MSTTINYVRRKWRAAREWWRSRPATGGLCMLLAACMLIWPPYASGSIGQMTIAVQTLGGASSLLIGIGLLVNGITLWTNPPRVMRIQLGVASVFLGVIAVVIANLGGFLIATTLAILGGAFSIPWRPVPTDTTSEEPTEPADTDSASDDKVVSAVEGVGSWPA